MAKLETQINKTQEIIQCQYFYQDYYGKQFQCKRKVKINDWLNDEYLWDGYCWQHELLTETNW